MRSEPVIGIGGFQSTPPVREETAKHTNVLHSKVFHIVQNHRGISLHESGHSPLFEGSPRFFLVRSEPDAMITCGSHYSISTSSGMYVGFAPMCSTLLLTWLPSI